MGAAEKYNGRVSKLRNFVGSWVVRMILMQPRPSSHVFSRNVLWLLLLFILARDGTAVRAENDDAPQNAWRVGFRVVIQVPIVAAETRRVRRAVDRWLTRQPETAQRPILVLEFEPSATAGTAGEFGAAFDLATYLTGPSVGRVQTVAFLPGVVTGHAVLAAMACEQIIMTPEAELGDAGKTGHVVMQTHRTAYLEIAARRGTIPAPVALGMLDSTLSVYRLEMIEGGVQYALGDELETLRPRAASEQKIIEAGELGRFPGRELRLRFGFVSHLVRDQKELAAALHLSPGALSQDPSLGGRWRGIQLDVEGRIENELVNRLLRGMRDHLKEEDNNLVCFRIRSAGGDEAATLRLAQEIAALNSGRVRTVAYVENQARSLAALVALACDDLVLQEKAWLGGPGDPHVSMASLDELRPVIKQLAQLKARDWSLFAGLVDHRLEVSRYSRPETGERRYFCADELGEVGEDAGWEQGDDVVLRKGIGDGQAVDLGLARHVVADLTEVYQRYELDEPLQQVDPPWISEQLERLSGSPWFARTMLFVAFFAILSEASAPGLGVAGFLSGCCFLLFFWAQFLNGNAGWLEVLLFGAGLLCVALELLVIPGFGVFGIGGGVMVIGSLLLASQTFVLPRNPYQVEQLTGSLWMVVFGLGGALVAVCLLFRNLHELPWLKHLALEPQSYQEVELQSMREALVNWECLMGQQGYTTTPLTPSGKARFGEQLVQVTSGSGAIATSQSVTVVDVQGNRVLVEVNEDVDPGKESSPEG